jgi:hypothetical protein
MSKGNARLGLRSYRFQILQGVQLRTETAVNTQELFVHDGGEWKRAKRFHAGVVDLL